MPWRLIVCIIVFIVFLIFITLNLDNRCDIVFGFAKLSDVPVFITIFTSFILGFSCALPLVLHFKKKKKEDFGKIKIDKKPKKDEPKAPIEPVNPIGSGGNAV